MIQRLRTGGITLRHILLAVSAMLAVGPAVAQETVTYGYDSKGHLQSVSHSGGAANGASASYNYDNADNRTTVTFTGAAGTAISLSPTSLPNGTVGTAYSQSITASGGTSPYTYTKT